MACLEEKDNKEDEKKSHSNVIDAIEAAKKLGSRRLDLSRRCITEIPSELNSLQKLEVTISTNCPYFKFFVAKSTSSNEYYRYK